MAKIGLVDLCTSHPESWVPILREMGHEVVACWDSGDTRSAGFAKAFAEEHGIALAAETYEEMIGKIDIAIIHSANWDKRVAIARPFVEAGVAVFLDKPMVGNLRDADTVLDWAKAGHRITGGSSVRYCYEIQDYLARPVEERGEAHMVFSGCAVDEFNYGIHAYSLVAGILGAGIQSVRYLGSTQQKQIEINWGGARKAIISIGALKNWIPFYGTIVTEKEALPFTVDATKIYKAMLETVMPYLAGKTDVPPVPMTELMEVPLAAIAARQSWMNDGARIFLSDLRRDDCGYDGEAFAVAYARTRIEAASAK